MPEAKAPKAKQRTITEQEIMAEAKQKAVPVQFLPSAQPYIAPPPKVSAQEIMAAATSKAVPKAQDLPATQTSKAVSPKAQDILATQTAKAKPKAQEPPSLPRPPPPREERASSSSAGQVAQVDVQDPDEIYGAFTSYLRGYYDNRRNTGLLIDERDSLEAINQNTGVRTLRRIGYLFDTWFIPTVIRRRIPVAV